MSNNSETVPMDVTAEQAEAVLRAAISWAWDIPTHQEHKMTRHEWVLFEALRKYGDEFKGLRAQAARSASSIADDEIARFKLTKESTR